MMAKFMVPELVLVNAELLARAEPFIRELCEPIESELAADPAKRAAFDELGWEVRPLVLGGALANGMTSALPPPDELLARLRDAQARHHLRPDAVGPVELSSLLRDCISELEARS